MAQQLTYVVALDRALGQPADDELFGVGQPAAQDRFERRRSDRAALDSGQRGRKAHEAGHAPAASLGEFAANELVIAAACACERLVTGGVFFDESQKAVEARIERRQRLKRAV